MKVLELQGIPADDLIVGKPLARDIYSRKGKLLLRKGTVIGSERQRDRLIQEGVYHNFYDVPVKSDDLIVRPSSSAIRLLQEIQCKVTRIFKTFREEHSEARMVEILHVSKMLVDACSADGDACLGSILTNKVSSYTVSHPIHVAILCALMGLKMRWKTNELLSLVAAALTSNLSKIELQEALYYQKEPLTDEQRRQIRQHPEETVEMLREAGVSNNLWLKSVLYHHESADGKGYPAGLRSYSIPVAARIIALCDIFCAAVTGRVYRFPLSPDDAIRMIFLRADRNLDNKIADMLVRLMGIYPPGTFVRLVNDETAVVTRRGKKAHQPVVHSIVGPDGRALPAPVKRDCSEREYAIKQTLHKDQVAVRIDPELLWRQRER